MGPVSGTGKLCCGVRKNGRSYRIGGGIGLLALAAFLVGYLMIARSQRGNDRSGLDPFGDPSDPSVLIALVDQNRDYLSGFWKSEDEANWVRIDEDGFSSFRLGDFAGSGHGRFGSTLESRIEVKFERNGKPHRFVVSRESPDEPKEDDPAFVYVASDPATDFGEILIELKMKKASN